jgi:hypothetical protein
MNPDPQACQLPFVLPDGRAERASLFAVRRMAAHGLRDVSAAWLMLGCHSTGFRRPLVLLRAFMLELAHTAQAPIRFAPCCAPRMTRHEALILKVLHSAAADLEGAEQALVELTGNSRVFEPLSAAVVFSRAIHPGAAEVDVAGWTPD